MNTVIIIIIISMIILSLIGAGGFYYYQTVLTQETPTTTQEASTTPPTTTQKEAVVPESNIPKGQAVSCTANDPGAGPGAIYRYMGSNTLFLYPDPTIANSWDTNWSTPLKTDCKNLTRGPDLSINVDGIINGQAVKCASNDIGGGANAVYRYIGNGTEGSSTLSMYPTSAIADLWDPNWKNPIKIDCISFTKGFDMPDIPLGSSVQCKYNDLGVGPGAVYRFTGNHTLKYYPSPTIASNWNSKWDKDIMKLDCAGFTKGSDVPSIPVGQAISCTANNPGPHGVYRYTGESILQGYPDPTIASSWDTNWGTPLTIDCASLKMGSDMTLGSVYCNKIKIYRMNNPLIGHLETINPINGSGYTTEAPLGNICSNQAPGSVPLYRKVSDNYHLTTLDQNEANSIFKLESTLGYVYTTQIPGTIPFYRRVKGNDHFLTTDMNEGAGYTTDFNTPMFYAFPN